MLIIGMILCAHAWCIWHVRDVETQTGVETAIIGADQMDGEWYQSYGLDGKKSPNGVLRDGRQTNSLSKKHVTISNRSDIFPSKYISSKHSDTSHSSSKGLVTTQSKSGPGSVSSDGGSTLASFAYLQDHNLATPYSTIGQNLRQNQGQPVQVHVQSNYNSVPRNVHGERTVQVRPYFTEQGNISHSNVLPVRRHSDDDYDNASDMQPILSYQSHQQVSPNTQWQQQQYQQQQQHPQWQHGGAYTSSWQQHLQQPHWQHQSQSNWRQTNPTYDEPPPAQPLVQPSARRPMTFEQMSSSKVSLYDNIQMAKMNDAAE